MARSKRSKRILGKIRGQLLVEMMIAMSVLMIGLLGVFSVLSQSLALNRIASNQYIASSLAAEGVEVVKNILDKNVIEDNAWNEGFVFPGGRDFGVQYNTETLGGAEQSNANKKLNLNEGTARYGYGAGTQTNFVRTVNVESVGSNEIKVVSKVEWDDRGGSHFDIEVEDHFLNWRAAL